MKQPEFWLSKMNPWNLTGFEFPAMVMELDAVFAWIVATPPLVYHFNAWVP